MILSTEGVKVEVTNVYEESPDNDNWMVLLSVLH